MAKTQAQLSNESDERRGMKAKSYKLKLETIEAIASAASELGVPQNQLIEDAVALYIKARL